jgi:hypothetical protein
MPLKVGEMIRLLEADGWYLVRVRGSYRHYRCVVLMREAIAGHLDVMREHGDTIPAPSAAGAFTVVAA